MSDEATLQATTLQMESTLQTIVAMLERLLHRTEEAQQAMEGLKASMTSLEQRVDTLLLEIRELRLAQDADDDLSPRRVIQ